MHLTAFLVVNDSMSQNFILNLFLIYCTYVVDAILIVGVVSGSGNIGERMSILYMSIALFTKEVNDSQSCTYFLRLVIRHN